MEKDSIKAMNKIMFFMVNCGSHEVKQLLYSVFDSNLACHIFDKYIDMRLYTNDAFFNIYFEVDVNCRKKICEYILLNYNEEQQLYV